MGRPAQGAIDVTWITQREYPFLGFNVFRAPDVNGAPGAFAQINTLIVPPSLAGDPNINADDDRTPYLYVDSDPGLALGRTYWYRVAWVDGLGSHLEPPAPAEFGVVPRVATLYYGIAHNAVDNDLFIRVGTDHAYDPGTHVGDADFERLGSPEVGQDSARVLLPTPANTGTSTIGTIEHFWSLGLTSADNVGAYLPPSMSHPWFLKVQDGGYVNRTGRVTSFSMFVNTSPGSASGTTYVTNHQPMPQPTGEFGLAPALLWIPEQPTVPVEAHFEAVGEPGAVQLVLRLEQARPGTRARVYRSMSDDFATRQALTDAVPFSGREFVYSDATAEPGVTYYYWIEHRDTGEGTIFNGPVAAAAADIGRATRFLSRQNPVTSGAQLAYVIGREAAGRGPVQVAVSVHDVRGRLVRRMDAGREGPGAHEMFWDARDASGHSVPAGVYYLRLHAGSIEKSAKVTVVR